MHKKNRGFFRLAVNSIYQLLKKDLGPFSCHMFKSGISVLTNGEIYPCSLSVDNKQGGLKFGTVFEGINPKRSERIEEIKKRVLEHYKECKRCWARYLCFNRCIAPSKRGKERASAREGRDIFCDIKRLRLEHELKMFSILDTEDLIYLLLGGINAEPDQEDIIKEIKIVSSLIHFEKIGFKHIQPLTLSPRYKSIQK